VTLTLFQTSSRGSSFGQPLQGGMNLQAVHSTVIDVAHQAEQSSTGKQGPCHLLYGTVVNQIRSQG
jgi:hypothetical protein